MERHIFKRFTAFVFLLALAMVAQADYADVNGIKMYYEVKGRGTPIVMLHGGYADADMWDVERFFLSFRHKVITIDSRGHGRSTDDDSPITYEKMTEDTLALLDHLNVPNAHFVGWSDGAVIASQIAADNPERVNQLVLIGVVYESDAYIPAFSLLLDTPNLFNAFINETFGKKYEKTSPTPENWPAFRDKLYSLWQTPCYFADATPDNCLEKLQQINAPTLVLGGGLEIIEQSHFQEIAATIPGAELKIVPLASHFLPIGRPILTTDIISRFLNN